jgi:hypothetical protein
MNQACIAYPRSRKGTVATTLALGWMDMFWKMKKSVQRDLDTQTWMERSWCQASEQGDVRTRHLPPRHFAQFGIQRSTHPLQQRIVFWRLIQ